MKQKEQPAVASTYGFAHGIATEQVPLTDELRAAIAHLNAVCALKHNAKTPEPPKKEALA